MLSKELNQVIIKQLESELIRLVGRKDEIFLLPDDEIINCSEIVYVREVKQ